MAVDVKRIKEALMDVVPQVNGQKAELREALKEVLRELDDDPADMIRSAVVTQGLARRKPHGRRRLTSPEEIERQWSVLIDYVKGNNPCEAGDAIDYLVDSCAAIRARTNPHSTAIGRVQSAIKRELVAWSGDSYDKKGQPIVKSDDLLEVAPTANRNGASHGS